MKKINDFGEKIGGAKKDIWALFKQMSKEQQDEMACKNVLWKRTRDDVPKVVRFWRNEMRKAVVVRPKTNTEEYVEFCLSFKEAVEGCKTMEDIGEFYSSKILQYMEKLDDHRWKYKSPLFPGFFDARKVLKYAGNLEQIAADIKEKYRILHAVEMKRLPAKKGYSYLFKTEAGEIYTFHSGEDYIAFKEAYIAMKGNRQIGVCQTKEEAEKAIEKEKRAEKRKTKERFLPPHLENIERTGSDYHFFRMSDGNVLMSRYGLRGGEFGNYTTSKDRLGSINMAYDAFEDLRNALGISAKDISLGGDLAIAFGARGRGNAMAHYEPDRNVINMTKIRGAGSLAHEWAHALDHYLGNHYGAHGYLSANTEYGGAPVSDLVSSFLEINGTETSFYKCSKQFDDMYGKSGNGYWSSIHEMFARAFACYVKDKLDGRKSDYLVGHAEYAAVGEIIAYPIGEERRIINDRFDIFFDRMIAEGVFHHESEKTARELPVGETTFFCGEGGQLRFC